jgi:hypothetical protein
MNPSRTTSRRANARRPLVAAAVLALAATAGAPHVLAAVVPGTPGNDVTVGSDRDNASNSFLQPPGVSAKQHLDRTDVLFGRAGDDLLAGRLGDDVLVGGPGHDIAVGGKGSDTFLGDDGDDVSVWSPGDGSETFVGDVGTADTQVVGTLLTQAGGGPQLKSYAGRQVPRVDLDGQSYTCTLVAVPAAQQLGEQYILRLQVGGSLQATLRLKDVERVVCAGRCRHGAGCGPDGCRTGVLHRADQPPGRRRAGDGDAVAGGAGGSAGRRR